MTIDEHNTVDNEVILPRGQDGRRGGNAEFFDPSGKRIVRAAGIVVQVDAAGRCEFVKMGNV